MKQTQSNDGNDGNAVKDSNANTDASNNPQVNNEHCISFFGWALFLFSNPYLLYMKEYFASVITSIFIMKII